MSEDRYGLTLTTASARAVAEYVAGVDALFAAQPGAEEAFGRAIEADPEFALAHAARARVLQMRGDIAPAREAAARARSLAVRATRHERRHAEAIALGMEPDLPRALEAVRLHLIDVPRDALVLSLVTGVYSLTGASGRQDRNELLLGLLDSVAPAYGEDWWFLAVHGFACTESGKRLEGRRKVERSLELHPRNGHAAHALAHVFYEEGDSAAGAAFVDSWLPGYERAAQLHCHLSWHLALFELAEGRADRATRLYEENMRPGVSLATATGTLADCASFLWRCRLWSVGSKPLPWGDVRDLAMRAFPKPSMAFADQHVVMACAAAGDDAATAARLAALREVEEVGLQPAGRSAGDVAEGMAAFARGDYPETIRLIAPVLDDIVRLGGSRAQRDVFEQTLLGAYLHAGRREEAKALFRARLEGRPAGGSRPIE